MIKFLLKGLLRDRSRSLFPLIIVAMGACLTVVSYGFINGMLGGMVDSSARFDTGHVKIVTKAYSEIPDQLPNDLALLGVDDLIGKLKRDFSSMLFTPRIRFRGLMDIPNEQDETQTQGPVFGIAIDMHDPQSPEKKIIDVEKALVKGTMPREDNEILIGDDYAQRLNVGIGETATFLGSTMNGSIVIQNFKVVGTLRFGMAGLDNNNIALMDINTARLALDMPDGASEIVGYTDNMSYDNAMMSEITKQFNNTVSNTTDPFSPKMLSLRDQGGMAVIVDMANAMGKLFNAVFLIAIAIVLWNSGLLGGIRRYSEMGIRLALGESKPGIYRSMILESVFIGLFGSIAGTLLGLLISYYMQEVGVDISGEMKNAGIIASNIARSRLTGGSYYIGFIPGIFAPVLGTMLAGIGIYKRRTAQLFKELEV